MQPLSDRVGGDLEHDPDLGNGEVLPRPEQEHLDVGATKARDRLEDEPAGIVVEHRLVSGRRGMVHDGAHSGLETMPTRRAPPLVANHAVGHPVQPHQRRIAIRDILTATPRSEEHLGDRIIDRITRQAAAAIGVDRSEVTAVELAEPGVLAAQSRTGLAPPSCS